MSDSEIKGEGSVHWQMKGNGISGNMPSIFKASSDTGTGKGKGPRFASREDVKDAYYWCRDEFNHRLGDQQVSVMKALQHARYAKKLAIVGTGGALLSIMIAGMDFVDRLYSPDSIGSAYTQHEERTRLTYLAVSNSVHQLDQQIAMLIAEKKQNDHEANLERYEENDKFGALLKAVDALKSQVSEMQWYVNDDTRDIMSDLRKHLDRLNKEQEQK